MHVCVVSSSRHIHNNAHLLKLVRLPARPASTAAGGGPDSMTGGSGGGGGLALGLGVRLSTVRCTGLLALLLLALTGTTTSVPPSLLAVASTVASLLLLLLLGSPTDVGVMASDSSVLEVSARAICSCSSSCGCCSVVVVVAAAASWPPPPSPAACCVLLGVATRQTHLRRRGWRGGGSVAVLASREQGRLCWC